jgi:hypothetical protein
LISPKKEASTRVSNQSMKKGERLARKNLTIIRKNNHQRFPQGFPMETKEIPTKEEKFPDYVLAEVSELSSVGPFTQGPRFSID